MKIDILNVVTQLLALFLSLGVHEAAHAFVAHIEGDDTAKNEGRLSLNPLVHADPFGTFLFPLMGVLLSTGIIFGWAKPVPVNSRNFKRGNFSDFIVAFAGPLSNLLLSALCILILFFYQKIFYTKLPSTSFFFPLVKLAEAMIWVNAVLAFFNLIPLPPLDGGTLLTRILPSPWGDKYYEIVAPYGFFILIALSFTGLLKWIFLAAVGYVTLVEKCFISFL